MGLRSVDWVLVFVINHTFLLFLCLLLNPSLKGVIVWFIQPWNSPIQHLLKRDFVFSFFVKIGKKRKRETLHKVWVWNLPLVLLSCDVSSIGYVHLVEVLLKDKNIMLGISLALLYLEVSCRIHGNKLTTVRMFLNSYLAISYLMGDF